MRTTPLSDSSKVTLESNVPLRAIFILRFGVRAWAVVSMVTRSTRMVTVRKTVSSV